MKKILLFLFCFAVFASEIAAQCTPNPLADSTFVYPTPAIGINKKACKNTPYEFVFSLSVPDQFVYQGFTIGLNYVKMNTVGAIDSLPAGLSYQCNPPSCQFNKNTAGCLRIFGSPSNSNPAPKDFKLVIRAEISTALGILNETFPGQLFPGEYTLTLLPQGDAGCVTAASDVSLPNFRASNQPNPFNGTTQIAVNTPLGGDFNFKVSSVTGQTMYQSKIHLDSGENTFIYDGSDLSSGFYVYSFEQNGAIVSGKMAVSPR